MISMGKAKKVAGGTLTQFDESSAGAGAVNYDKEEATKVITGKMVERINAQYDLRTSFIDAQYYYQELKHLEKVYGMYDMLVKDNFHEEIPKWKGIDMPKDILACEFQVTQHRWKKQIMSMKTIIARLKCVGFTEEDIKNVKQGKVIIKDHNQLQKMESVYEEKGKKSDKG